MQNCDAGSFLGKVVEKRTVKSLLFYQMTIQKYRNTNEIRIIQIQNSIHLFGCKIDILDHHIFDPFKTPKQIYVFYYPPVFVANGDVVVVIKDDNLAAKQKNAAYLYLYYFHFIFISVFLYICFFCISVFFFVANGDVVVVVIKDDNLAAKQKDAALY